MLDQFILNQRFLDSGELIFKNLQVEYNLRLEKHEAVLKYQNIFIDFSIYFDRFLEIYIAVVVNGRNLSLVDIARWGGINEEFVLSISKNQIGTEKYIDTILKNLSIVMEELIPIIQKDPLFLSDCLAKQLAFEKQQQEAIATSRLLLQFDKAWKEKDYNRFMVLFEANRAEITKSSCFSKIQKQLAYIRKVAGNA